MVLVKNLNFFHLFILGLMGQENVFVDILQRKKTFLDPKITKFKKSKIWYFGILAKSASKMCLTLL